jgi:hypothetical protein
MMELNATLALLEITTLTLMEFAFLVSQEPMLAIMAALPAHNVQLDSLHQTQQPSIVRPAHKATQRRAMVKLNVSKKRLRSQAWSQLQPQFLAMIVQLHFKQLGDVNLCWPMGI